VSFILTCVFTRSNHVTFSCGEEPQAPSSATPPAEKDPQPIQPKIRHQNPSHQDTLPSPRPRVSSPRRNSTPSPRPRMPSPHCDRSRSPHNHSRKRQNRARSPGNRALSQQRGRSSSPSTGEAIETSYRRKEGKRRGGRIMEMIDGRQVIKRTQMERLKGRKAKHRWVMEHGHWLGRKMDIWFNPYTKSDQLTVKNCPAISRPQGQAGRGEFLIHEAIGLTDDYDTFLDIRVRDLFQRSDVSNILFSQRFARLYTSIALATSQRARTRLG
jgi:hypothetical protein